VDEPPLVVHAALGGKAGDADARASWRAYFRW